MLFDQVQLEVAHLGERGFADVAFVRSAPVMHPEMLPHIATLICDHFAARHHAIKDLPKVLGLLVELSLHAVPLRRNTVKHVCRL